MKPLKLGLFLLATLLCGTLIPKPAHANPGVSFEFFYDTLDPYGEWVDLPDYGLCWRPSQVDADWAPYTDGYWVNTDAGWTWVSYEDWGGITYHYGRWARMPDEGWFWVPDYEWAPAWVSWRYSDDYVGWAPLPPAARWEPRIGFSFWVDSHFSIGPTYYNFCRVRHFGNPALRPVIIDRRRNVTIINQTTNITNITVTQNTQTVYNGGPSFAAISRRSERPIQVLKLRQETQVANTGDHHRPVRARQQGQELLVVAPKMEAPVAKFTPRRPARTLSSKPIDTGWAGISDPKVRTQIQSKLQREVKDVIPAKAPAVAPSQRELKSFDQRLQSQANLQALPHPRQSKKQFPTNPSLVEPLAPQSLPTPSTAVRPAADPKQATSGRPPVQSSANAPALDPLDPVGKSNARGDKPIQPPRNSPQGSRVPQREAPPQSVVTPATEIAPTRNTLKEQPVPTQRPQTRETPVQRNLQAKPDGAPSNPADQRQNPAAQEQLQGAKAARDAQAAEQQRRQEALQQQSRIQEQNRRTEDAALQQRRQQQAGQEQLQRSQAAEQQRRQEALQQQSRIQEQNRRTEDAALQQRRQQQAAQEQLQRAQEAQQRRAEQIQRMQQEQQGRQSRERMETQRRQSEQISRPVERATVPPRVVAPPTTNSRDKKDKEKD